MRRKTPSLTHRLPTPTFIRKQGYGNGDANGMVWPSLNEAVRKDNGSNRAGSNAMDMDMLKSTSGTKPMSFISNMQGMNASGNNKLSRFLVMSGKEGYAEDFRALKKYVETRDLAEISLLTMRATGYLLLLVGFHSVGWIKLGEMENNVDRSKHDALNKLDGVAEGLLERIRRSRALRASESDVNPKPLKSIMKRSIQSLIAKDNNGVRKVSMNPTTMVWEVETDYASPIRNADESGFQPSLTSERVGSTHTNAHENVVTADKGVSNATDLANSSSKQQGGPNANEPMADANIVGASMDSSYTNTLTNATKQAAGPKVNTSFASVIKSNQNKVMQITELRNEEHMEGAAVTIPLSAIEEVSSRFANTLYGYFVGKRLAFRLVKNYVQNVWAKFGIKRIQLHGDFFLFQFETKEDSDLHKAKIKKVPVWVKLHHVPIVAYSKVGLSLITTQIGKPIRLDAYTSNMCLQSWGCSAYARALIEVSAEDAPKEELVIAIPLGKNKGHSLATIRIEYEWTPPRCSTCLIFDHTEEKCPKRPKEVTTTVVTNVEVNHSKDVADDDRGNSTKQSGSYFASTSKEGGKSAATSTQSKNVRLENSFSALNDDEDNEWKDNTTWQHSQQVLDVPNESDSEVDEVITLDDRGGNLKTF
ncbi:probable methyltransferase PMT28 isoform X1 [Tanacetum coccineum]